MAKDYCPPVNPDVFDFRDQSERERYKAAVKSTAERQSRIADQKKREVMGREHEAKLKQAGREYEAQNKRPWESNLFSKDRGRSR